MKHIHPRRVIRMISKKVHDWFFFYLIPDEWEIRYHFKKILGYKCNLKSPKTFNEKIQWLKIHDRNPLYHELIDKIRVKSFVGNKLGSDYVIPTISGGFSRFDDIPFDELPDQFVLKCNHDCKSVVICTDKSTFDFSAAKAKIEKALQRDFYHHIGKPWGCKGITPLVFAESFMGEGLRDYKFFMFNGQCKCIATFDDRFVNRLRSNFYDLEWNLLPFIWGECPNTDYSISKPENLDEMLSIATELASFVCSPFVRIDLYNIHNHVFFGEYTFYPGGGYDRFEPEEWDWLLGDYLTLPK